MKYKVYTLDTIHKLPQIKYLDDDTKNALEVVAHVLPFRVNNYVTDNLIDWENYITDPIFRLVFPHKDMLLPRHYITMQKTLEQTSDKYEIKQIADSIRRELNPHPAGQKKHNIPIFHDHPFFGLQHKYRETVLFFPSEGQVCFSYCTFCFRWPQFVHLDDEKFSTKQAELLIEYLWEHPEVSDVLFTGGDPMVMKATLLQKYIAPIIESGIPTVKSIRIGSKAISYWPYKFISDKDAEDTLHLLQSVTDAGYSLAYMAHFNHYQEHSTTESHEAIRNILKTGAQIRTQSPLLNHINADPNIWSTMWRQQVNLGMIPYYFFIVRNTGAQHYFKIPLYQAHAIFIKAYRQVSGLARTVRGPSMSTIYGKIEISGILDIAQQKHFVLRFIQGRDPKWVNKPFLAQYSSDAIWIDDLQPSNGTEFFFQKEYPNLLDPKMVQSLSNLP